MASGSRLVVFAAEVAALDRRFREKHPRARHFPVEPGTRYNQGPANIPEAPS